MAKATKPGTVGKRDQRPVPTPPQAAHRAERDEDAEDLALARKILAKKNPRIPHDEVMRRNGL
jgi:hypothetical protein